MINEVDEKDLAKKIFDIPFVVSNLNLLKKKEILTLFESVNSRLMFENPEWHELDLKDVLFEQKCWLVECLDKDFFKGGAYD